MKKEIQALLVAGLVLTGMAAYGGPVKEVKGVQRWPWTGEVDIFYNLQAGNTAHTFPVFKVEFSCEDAGQPVTMTTLDGEGAKGYAMGNGWHVLIWNAGADYPSHETAKIRYGVYAGSFFGCLRAKLGNNFLFDLPTEAQWEYAYN